MIDKNLFVYLTKRAGKTLQDVADALEVPLSGVYKRLNSEVEFKRSEMDAWMKLVGVTDANPVFFAVEVANPLPAAAGGANGI